VFRNIIRAFNLIIYMLLGILLLTASNPIAGEPVERARAFTRPIEFDYVRWSVNAALLKLQSSVLGLPGYLTHEDRRQVVLQHLYLTERILQAEGQLNIIYADPNITDKEAASAHLRGELDEMYKRHRQLTPLAEATLQAQVGAVLAELDLTSGGQPVPPVLYHSSPVPMGLIISPLVVPIGGVGVYPTMVMRTTSLPWQLDTIAHEWAHNFLTLRPLGFLYDVTPAMRTMNETTASIVGNEVGTLVLRRYYPELGDASSPDLQLASVQPASPRPDGETPPFDFRAEMHTTRVTVDEMLAEGKIEEAEAYMEARREIFWENGYTIRKLNQAYFAFYGAYADVPGGAAGEDPVGPAVRELRAQSDSLAEFVNRISWMTSFAQLQAAIQ